MIGAAVDVGSNSVHLLVAHLRRNRLGYIRDESVLLGLGDAVDEQGLLPGPEIDGLVAALETYRQLAETEGAQAIAFIGTHPLRSAANSDEVCARLRAETGIRLQVLSETAEAQLTYIGVTLGRPLRRPLLVADIGGGSSELIVGRRGEDLRTVSLPSGSARLSRGIVLHDPPTPSEFDRLRLAAHGLVREIDPTPVEGGIFVGGTATNLAKIGPLSRAGLEAAHGVLTSTAQADLVERYVVNPRRAAQLPAGAALVEALLERFGLESVEVSQASLRDGAILAQARLGDDWPGRLAELSAARS